MKVLTTDFNENTLSLLVAPKNNVDLDNLVDAYDPLDSNLKWVKKDGTSKVFLEYKEEAWKGQVLASKKENINPFNIIDYTGGTIKLTPSVDSWVKTVIVETGKKTIVNANPKKFISQQIQQNVIKDPKTGQNKNQYNEYTQVGTKEDNWIRSRNIAFDASGFKPLTQYYLFFDGQSKNLDIIPKLIEINTLSGSFSIGETVIGIEENKTVFTAKVCAPSHKSGPIASPEINYNLNPYNTATGSLPKDFYSIGSILLNIDIYSLAEEALGDFSGYIKKGMKLKGKTSNAEAEVTDIRLLSNENGDLQGSFFIRDPYEDTDALKALFTGVEKPSSPDKVPPVKFSTGVKTFKLTSDPNDAVNKPGILTISSAETTYQATGIVEGLKQVTITVKPPPPPVDPLAQTFYIDTLQNGNQSGIFLSSVDIFFGEKDPGNHKVQLSIVTVELGIPTQNVVIGSVVYKEQTDILVSPNFPGKPTNFKFDSPIFLEKDKFYAIVLKSPTSDKFTVWVAGQGETIANETSATTASGKISKNEEGTLFKSQNAATWIPSPLDDLKYQLYKCLFTTSSGTLYLYNQSIKETNAVTKIGPKDPIKTLPRKLRVGITPSNNLSNILTIGTRVSSGNAGSTNINARPHGVIEQVGGPVPAGALTVTNAGIGYVNGTYSNVTFFNITGSGNQTLSGTVTVASNVVSAVSINAAQGNGFVTGDLIGIVTTSVGGKGKGAQITIPSITGIDTLYLTNVQGESLNSPPSQTVKYWNGTNYVALANTTFTSSNTVSDFYTGDIIQVTHPDHGMHSINNILRIDGVKSNIEPSTLSANLNLDTAVISIAATANFDTFEGTAVSGINTGYVKIKTEIIGYTAIVSNGTGGGELQQLQRGVDNTPKSTHSINDQVFKYELNNISLRRINTQYQMATIPPGLLSSKELDLYYLQINRDDKALGEQQISFNNLNDVGAGDVYITKNYQFNKIKPTVKTFIPSSLTTSSETDSKSVSITSQMRTVSGTSAGGSETSFLDQGYESVELNAQNKLSSVRLIASRPNELNQVNLSGLPNNRSFTLAMLMTTNNSELSPVIELDGGAASVDNTNATGAKVHLIRNCLDSPVSDYALDGRVNSPTSDPHASIYVTNKVNLKQSATSLKVLVDAYIHSSSDFRVLYQIFKPDSKEVTPAYILFPGYDNMIDTDGDGFGDKIIDVSFNNGKPDAKLPSSADGEFLEYQFSVDNLEQFTAFKIKLVMSGKNEAYSPQFKNFRVLALAWYA